MHEHDTESNGRLEVLISTLIYMMTLYQRSHRRDVALSIAAHLERLARHPDADDTVRRIADGMRSEWERSVPPAQGLANGVTVH